MSLTGVTDALSTQDANIEPARTPLGRPESGADPTGAFSRTPAEIVQAATRAAFATDYVVRLRLATQRCEFVNTHLPDALFVRLPMLRPLRVLRLLLNVLNRQSHSQFQRPSRYPDG
jgi:hypothetical protein